MNSVFDDDAPEMPRGLQLGDEVTIHYATKTLEGGVLETSRGREPFRFRIGDPSVVPGLSEALRGRRIGEHVSTRLSPDASFGHRRGDWQVSIPLTELPDGVAVGDQLAVTSVGQTFPAWVQKVSEREAVLDANHPLADETTLVEVDIVASQPAQADTFKH